MRSWPQRSHCCRCPLRAGVRHAPIARRALRCAAVVRRVRRKISASRSYDRAEIRLDAHTSLGRGLCGGVQNALERTDDIAQGRG